MKVHEHGALSTEAVGPAGVGRKQVVDEQTVDRRAGQNGEDLLVAAHAHRIGERVEAAANRLAAAERSQCGLRVS